MRTDKNVNPYFDDFNEAKKYYSILFSPKIAVQTRELNQIQSIQDDQRAKFANHIFEEGAAVKDGQISIDTNYKFIKVVANSGSNLESSLYRSTNFHNKEVLGSSGVRATILTSTNPVSSKVTFYLKYSGSDSTNGTTQTFSNNEVITVLDSNGDPTLITATLVSSNSSGIGSAANLKSGIFYVRGKFVIADQQTIILDAESVTPSYRIGFNIVETIVTSDDDSTLNDNSAGFDNYNAPGAHRHKVVLELTKLLPGTQGTDDFVQLAEVSSGVLVNNTSDVTQYSEIEKTLARRTHDESGDYTVVSPKLEVREFYNDGSNRGIYEPVNFEYTTEAEAKQVSIDRFGVISPGTSHVVSGKYRPGSSPSNLVSLMKAKIALGLDPSKSYVRGYEIRKLAREYVDLDKARTYDTANNATIKTKIGNYVLITNVYGIPDIKTFAKVSLYDRFTSTPGSAAAGATKIGEARIRGIDYVSGTVGTSSAVYKLYLFDIQVPSNYYFYNTKQVYVSGFTADISLTIAKLEGSITIGYAGTTATGVDTSWFSKNTLIEGDYIYALNNSSVGKYMRVTATPTGNKSLSVTAPGGSASPADDITGASFFYVYAELKEPKNAISVFNLPYSPVKTITSDGVIVDTNYTVRRYFDPQAVSSGQIVISTSHADEIFPDFSAESWMAVYTSGGSTGTVVNLTSGDLTYNISNTQVTISGLSAGSVAVIAPVRKVQGVPATAKTKALVLDSTVTVTSDAGLNEISLGKADILRVKSIYMSPDFSTSATTSHTNITDWYDLDNGQRDEFYDIGKIIKKSGFPKPSGRLLITFDYFTHGANGNYFSVDTYTVISGLEYEEIPQYVSNGNGAVYDLRDCMDFRPRIKDDASGFANTGGGSLTEFPREGNVYADFQYYLNRVDKLYLDQTGTFRIIKGVDGIDPSPPDNPSDGMVTHQLNVKAYTLSVSDVFVDIIDNKRYTMRDIGKLEKRIANLEYYTSLSLLEKSTNDLEILDADGLNRFKNGFIVDPFTGHGIGDVLSNDYKVSVDMEKGECRPMYWSENTKLIEENTTDLERGNNHYQITGDLITLPYEEVVLVNQPIASDIINVNPYNVVMFIGDIVLDPSNDEWKDTERLPDLLVNQEGNYDAVANMANGIGTIWNEWQTNWVGSPIIKKEVLNDKIEYGDNRADGQHEHNWPIRHVKTVRVTTTINSTQIRSGIKAVVTPNIVTENLGDRVINVAYIPYMRSREVHFKGKGFKPNTRLYPFFDDVDISEQCTAWADVGTPEPYDSNDTLNDTPLITDETGKASGTFKIPNTDTNRFRTGERVFRLTSSATNDKIVLETFGTAFYRAQGLLETKQATILSTRNAEVAWETVSEEKQLTDVSVSTIKKTGPWIDPIAETFLIEKEGGCFLTSIDLYFQSKDLNIPVMIEIRETVNGYPGSTVLPFSRVIKDAADVSISADATEPTTFTFDSPVYCRQGVEYCFVVLANTNKYNVWIATLRHEKIGTKLPIQDQPYNGSFFKSQNASTWTADQESDIMFTLRSADFDISDTGTVVFNNDEIPSVELGINPIYTKNGESKIRVYHQNHGFRSDGSKQSKVTIAGSSAVNGIDAVSINTTHDIISCDLDSYVLDTGDTATATGFGGGSSVSATENRQMDVVQPIISNLVVPGTDMKLYIKPTSSKSVHPSSDADDLYVLDSNYIPVVVNENYEFSMPKLIASSENESEHMSGNKSLFVKALLTSTNSNISPVIDIGRVSVTTIGNRLDNPQVTGDNSINDADLDINEVLTTSANVVFTAATSAITSTNSTVAASLSQLQKGKYITVSGTSNNNGTYRLVSVVYTPSDSTKITVVVDGVLTNESPGSTTVSQYERYVDELAPSSGSASAKYLNRRMVLAQVSNSIQILIGGVRPASSSIIVYYRTARIDETQTLDDVDFKVATVDSDPGFSASSRDIKDYRYTINDLPDFNAVQVKVVMLGSNTCEVPRIRDFRCVALGT